MQVYIDSPDSLLASFVSGKETGRLILVTGQSGSGKTRWCQALAEQAKAQRNSRGWACLSGGFRGCPEDWDRPARPAIRYNDSTWLSHGGNRTMAKSTAILAI